MNSVKLRSRAGADGILNIKVPVGVTNAEVEVVVVFQLVERAQTPKTPEELGWPPGFLSRLLEHGRVSRSCVVSRVSTKSETNLPSVCDP